MLLIDWIASIVFCCEMFTLPVMVLYLFTPYQTLNLFAGVILGYVAASISHKRFIETRRIFGWFIVFNITLVYLIVLKKLCLAGN